MRHITTEKIKEPVCPACNFDLPGCVCGRIEKEDAWDNYNPLMARIFSPAISGRRRYYLLGFCFSELGDDDAKINQRLGMIEAKG